MPRDLRHTKQETEFFELVKDFNNPNAKLFDTLFARHAHSEPKYRVDDIIEITSKQSPFVKEHSATTVGIYLVNKFIIEPFQVFGYVNKTFTDKVWSSLEDKIAEALLDGKITQETVCEYIDRSQYLLGGPLAHIINPSLSSAILNLPPKAKKLQKELMEKNKDRILNNDPNASAEISNAVVTEALKDIKAENDPSISLFTSGAVDPYNNYRTMFVMKGAIKDNTGESPTGYKIVTSNYNDGISKEDVGKIADALVTSSYSSGVATQDSGTLGKKYNAVLQRVHLADKGSDCGTKQYLKTIITKRHLYRYIVENGKLIQLTPDTIEKYKGKVCNLRSPIYCKSKDPTYCNICCGDRLYRIGVHNLGLTFSIVSGSTLNLALKTKHDSSVKTYRCKIDDLMKYVK